MSRKRARAQDVAAERPKDPWRVAKQWPPLRTESAGSKVWILKVPGVVAQAWQSVAAGGALGEVKVKEGEGTVLKLSKEVAKKTRMREYRFVSKVEGAAAAAAASSASRARTVDPRERLVTGSLVEICGLSTKAEHNGREGSVKGRAKSSAGEGYHLVEVYGAGPGGRSETLTLHASNMRRLVPKYLYEATTTTTMSSAAAIAAGARREVRDVSAEITGRVTRSCRLQPPRSALGGGLKRTKYKKLCRSRIVQDEAARPGVTINKNIRAIRAETHSTGYNKVMSTARPKRDQAAVKKIPAGALIHTTGGAYGMRAKLAGRRAGNVKIIDLVLDLFKQERYLTSRYVANEIKCKDADVLHAMKKANEKGRYFVFHKDGDHYQRWEYLLGPRVVESEAAP